MAERGDAGGTRWTLYLSGGGFRAALSALGAVYGLLQCGVWPHVRGIVSVSGGGLVNAWLATHRPADAELPQAIAKMYGLLTSPTRSLLNAAVAFGPPIVLGAGTVFLAIAAGFDGTTRAFAVTVLVLGWLVLLMHVSTRVWVRSIVAPFSAGQRLGALERTGWMREHVFATTVFDGSGSLFLAANPAVALAFSWQRGTFDARAVTFAKALRATTAFPPLIPPTRFRPASGVLPTAENDAITSPRASGFQPMWLADGGITGNLGVQLDLALSPNSAAARYIANAKARGRSGPEIDCPHHPGQVSWNCAGCVQRSIIVDSSGRALAISRFTGILLAVPLLGTLFHAVRTLQVMYDSHLSADAALAGAGLVSANRIEPLLASLALDRVGDPPATDANLQSIWAGGYTQWQENAATFAKLFTPLQWACVCARAEAATVRTNLVAVPGRRAMVVAASGYLNTVLNVSGPDSFETAKAGIRELDALLRADGRLVAWWKQIGADYGCLQRDEPLPEARLVALRRAGNPTTVSAE